MPGFEYVKYNDPEALERLVAEINGGDDGRKVAAILMEPLQGAGSGGPMAGEARGRERGGDRELG